MSNQLAVLRERDNADPVTRGLARGEYRAGSSMDELIAAHPPKRVERFGRFTDVDYANGPSLIAVDGKLVFARLGWCSHSTIFFNQFTPALAAEYEASAKAEEDRVLKERADAHGAVGGVLGHFPHDPRFREGANPPVP